MSSPSPPLTPSSSPHAPSRTNHHLERRQRLRLHHAQRRRRARVPACQRVRQPAAPAAGERVGDLRVRQRRQGARPGERRCLRRRAGGGARFFPAQRAADCVCRWLSGVRRRDGVLRQAAGGGARALCRRERGRLPRLRARQVGRGAQCLAGAGAHAASVLAARWLAGGAGGAAAVPPQVFQGLVPDDVLDHRGAQLRGARLAAVTLWGADAAGDAGGGLRFRPLPHSPRH